MLNLILHNQQCKITLSFMVHLASQITEFMAGDVQPWKTSDNQLIEDIDGPLNTDRMCPKAINNFLTSLA